MGAAIRELEPSSIRNVARLRDEPLPKFVATILTPGLVRPLTVYAAGRKSFDVMTCCEMKPAFALALIFSRLPLEQLGWEYKATQIEFAGRSDSFPIWKLTRG
jgi:hypothetical protein